MRIVHLLFLQKSADLDEELIEMRLVVRNGDLSVDLVASDVELDGLIYIYSLLSKYQRQHLIDLGGDSLTLTVRSFLISINLMMDS